MDENELSASLAKAKQGDPESLAAICEHFYPKVLKYMYYRVGGAWAEDLAADVFVRVMRAIARQDGSFVAWVYKIAANVVIDHSRREKLRQGVPMDENITETMAGASDSAMTATRHIDLHEAISRLTEEQRELVTLKFIQGLSNTEVAAITGRKAGAIRVLQFRALSSLREMLSDEEKNDGA
ncbi:MAG: sigma-70 family RNA polymerase sigma factor [Planctomycetes bacterium]|nr:sigma-70 family RNA polymerase sigma factor [Planctomycetota bacterium]